MDNGIMPKRLLEQLSSILEKELIVIKIKKTKKID